MLPEIFTKIKKSLLLSGIGFIFIILLMVLLKIQPKIFWFDNLGYLYVFWK